MLFHNLTTNTRENELLETEGMIYLNAYDRNGNSLPIVQGKLNVQMPTRRIKDGIHIFYGEEQREAIKWNLANEKLTAFDTDSVPQIVEVTPKIGRKKIFYRRIGEKDTVNTNQAKASDDKMVKNENLITYVFQISKMGWINCDRYIESKEPLDLLVEVNSKDKEGKFYLVFGNSNSILVGDEMPNNESKLIFKNIPKNDPVTIVGISVLGDEIYFGIKDYKATFEAISFPPLVSTSRQELISTMLDKFGKDIWSRPRHSL